jgi:hypothetical protein
VLKLDLAVQACRPSSLQAEAEGPEVGDQPGLYSYTLCHQRNEGREREEEGEEIRDRERTIVMCILLFNI